MIIYTMDTIYPKNSVFLAGPTVRVNGENNFTNIGSWRTEAIKLFESMGFHGNILVPEYKNGIKPNGWTYAKQVEWETEALNKASIIIFWIPRNMETLPAFTTNIEFGEWFKEPNVVCGSPIDAPKNEYLKFRYNAQKRIWNNTLAECVTEAVNKLNRKGTIFFTSDTHFGAQRTLELSKRPFLDVAEMDLKLIHNWNSMITMNDTVFHLGDIGTLSTIHDLNFNKLYVLAGNYENKEDIRLISSFVNVQVIDEGFIADINVEGVNHKFELVHEPTHSKHTEFTLFGHIHRLCMVKKFGLNVGVDAHNYRPIDIKTVLFYKNGIQNFYDGDVFC